MVAGTKILSESSFGQMACMGRGCVPLLVIYVYIVSGFLPPLVDPTVISKISSSSLLAVKALGYLC